MYELAKRILEETDGKICNHCLGRKLSKIMEGNDNVDRALKVSEELNINLNDNECIVCGNIFDKIDLANSNMLSIHKLTHHTVHSTAA